MAKRKLLGELERQVMEHLWQATEPQTVREVQAGVSERRPLAYTTVMTVLRRLTDKGLVVRHRADKAHRYAAVHRRDEMIADLMADALDQIGGAGDRRAALMYFVERVGADDVHVLQRALARLA